MGIGFIQLVVDELHFNVGQLNKKEKKVVREVVFYALNQTRAHIARTRDTRGDVPSAILSNIWLSASQDLLKYHSERIKNFAATLEVKSRYWSDPKGFNKELLDEYEMRLNQVEEVLNELTQ